MWNSGRYAFMVKKEWRKESMSCREARSKSGNTGKVTMGIGSHIHVEVVAEKIALDRRIS